MIPSRLSSTRVPNSSFHTFDVDSTPREAYIFSKALIFRVQFGEKPPWTNQLSAKRTTENLWKAAV